jgi:hypothetical protein
MKIFIITKWIVVLLLIIVPSSLQAQDPILEAIKEATKRVIRAVDLQVQRLQNNTIDLQNAQKQLENILSKLKLQEIADWTNKQKELYQSYFDELWKVKTYLLYYRQFKDVIEKQKQLFAEYKRAVQITTGNRWLSAAEKDYVFGVYSNILEGSLQDISDLLNFMQSFTLQISDGARLEKLSVTAESIDDRLAVLRKFNERNQMMTAQRAKGSQGLEEVQKLFGN